MTNILDYEEKCNFRKYLDKLIKTGGQRCVKDNRKSMVMINNNDNGNYKKIQKAVMTKYNRSYFSFNNNFLKKNTIILTDKKKGFKVVNWK